MGAVSKYQLRLLRKRLLVRSMLKQSELVLRQDNTAKIRQNDLLLFSTLRNEKDRLPYFIDYYRRQGIGHFFFIDNDSTDDSSAYLTGKADVSLWYTSHSYKRANFGTDWINGLLKKYGQGHWCLSVDPDEFLIYPFHDTRPLQALTQWLDESSIKSFSAMLLDMYPKGAVDEALYQEHENPFDLIAYFDSGNYLYRHNKRYGHLWIQGGPRMRCFFANNPEQAPALNKIPLVKWDSGYVYTGSTHVLLPRGLNQVYSTADKSHASGCLLHAKFIKSLIDKTQEELERQQHYAQSAEYKAYHRTLTHHPSLWCEYSTKFENWRQLERLGLISKGNWA